MKRFYMCLHCNYHHPWGHHCGAAIFDWDDFWKMKERGESYVICDSDGIEIFDLYRVVEDGRIRADH
jgi:hypothetical protein